MFHLGIDTGGTYTDAVLLDSEQRVRAAAKAPTTRQDLAIGIAEAVRAVLGQADCKPADIALVGLSTTLATNAIVEGQGGRVGLILIGFAAAQLERAGLARALAGDPFCLIGGGHSAFGDEAAPLDLGALDAFIAQTRDRVQAYALAGLFSVRNAEHERRASERIARSCALPISASHVLASDLDGPRRALTALLNARLVPIIHDLIASLRNFLRATGIQAPLMVVRGNGALMAAAEARRRPVETILSGPAASAVGGCFLTGIAQGLVADIGGTTTDLGLIRDFLPVIDPLGASIAGYRTMVEAIQMSTIGLGGDSEVAIDEAAPLSAPIALGPRRIQPIGALASEFPDLVHASLDQQLLRPLPGAFDGKFARLLRVGRQIAPEPADAAMLAMLADGPKPLETLLKGALAQGRLQRLVRRGAIGLAGLTPSDAAHILGRQQSWDAEASRKAAQLFLRRRNRVGQMHAPAISGLAQMILDALVAKSADFILDSAAAIDGFPEPVSQHPLARRAFAGQFGLVRSEVAMSLPIVGLGAAAPLYYPAIAQRLRARCEIPEHAGVANAVGAVVGLLRREAKLRITQPEPGRFRLHAGAPKDFATLEAAQAAAEAAAREAAFALLQADGAEDGEIRLDIAEKSAELGGETMLVEMIVTAYASGRPALQAPAPNQEKSIKDALS